jgi:hypothetical protein
MYLILTGTSHVVTAFLNPKIDNDEIYMAMPEGIEEHKVIKKINPYHVHVVNYLPLFRSNAEE